MPLDITNITKNLGDAQVKAGLALEVAGAVQELRKLQAGRVITGVVNDRTTYRVYIALDGDDIDGECGCDVGENCLHVAAVLLHSLQAQQTKAAQEIPALSPSQNPAANSTQQQLLYLLQYQVKADCCINQACDISLSLWVGQKQAQGGWQCTAFLAPRLNSGNYPRYVQQHDIAIINNLLASLQGPKYSLRGELGSQILQACVNTGRSFWHTISGTALQTAATFHAQPRWVLDTDAQQTLNLGSSSVGFIATDISPPTLVDSQQQIIRPLSCELDAASLQRLIPLAPLSVENARDFNKANPDLPQTLDLEIQPQDLHTLKPELRLFTKNGHAVAQLNYHYNHQVINSHQLKPNQKLIRYVDKGEIFEINRDQSVEAQFHQQLTAFTLDTILGLFTMPNKCGWLSFMLLQREAFITDGWQITVDGNFPYRMAIASDWYGELNVDDSQQRDWFSLELGIIVDGQPVNVLPMLLELLGHYSPAVLSGEKSLSDEHDEQQINENLLMQLEDGRYVAVPVLRVEKILQTLVELFDNEGLDDNKRLLLPFAQASRLALLADDEEDQIAWRGDEALQALTKKISSFSGIKPVQASVDFNAELRPYQREGLAWLQFLRDFKLGGILADDMGLGKTVQTLAHICLEKSAGRLTKPVLIIAPTSVISNWQQEAKHFAPALKLLTLHGAKRKHLFRRISNVDVVFSTYPLLNFDSEVLLAHEYYMLILDEAQTIKNPRAKASQVVRQIQTEHRLCLTGTPMENHLGELWSLFDFLQPGLLNSELKFQKQYRTPIERDASEQRALGLSQRLAPFILRRTKEKVAPELPPKTEILRQVSMGDEQRDLYDSIRLTMHKKVRKAIKDQGFARSQITVLDALLKLRQVCCDPRLLSLENSQGVTQSGKFETLMTMLPQLVEEGRRILLFSQFTSMLALIESAVQDLGIKYLKLTGQSKDRGALVQKFQSGNFPLFLISLKAGGTGLNLTAADTVIHYDPWWNPAAENQATDRAYRIGQDKPVFVYKLVTEATVEEKILALQQRKQALADGVYSAKASSPSRLNQEDLAQLFGSDVE